MQDRDREREFRQAAADCLELAKATTDHATRAALLAMAQTWIEFCEAPFDQQFEQVLADFNDRQMMQPVSPPPAPPQPTQQQQQQIQPLQGDHKD